MNVELLLLNVAKHVQLDKVEADFFISLLEHKLLKKKDFLLKQGTVCRGEYFIINGCLRTYTIDDNGVEHIVTFGIEDWWVGDLYSFLTQKPSSYYIDALENTELVFISKDNLDLLYEKVPKFERYFRLILQNAFVAQQIRINQNLSFTAEEKYLNFIRKYPQLEQRISQKQVSAYLGITPVFLSILRRKRLQSHYSR